MVDDIILVGAMFLFAVFVIGSIVHYISEEIDYYRWQKEEKRKKVK